MIQRKINRIFTAVALAFIFSAKQAGAACPVCTLAVGGALVLLERYGVDNTISGLWIGGFLLSSSLWAIKWIRKREWGFNGVSPLIIILFYGMLILPLYSKDIIGAFDNMIWDVDKTLLGIATGSIFFYFGHWLHLQIKAANGGKSRFIFQSTVVPVIALALLSIVFYLITRDGGMS